MMSEESTSKKVKLGEAEYEVPAEVAAAMEQQTKDIEENKSAYSALSDKLDAIQKNVSTYGDKINNIELMSSDEKTSTESELFDWSNPDESLKKIKEEAKAEAKAEFTEEFNQKQSQKSQQQQFWDGFYKKNKEFDREKDGFLVNAILQRDMDEFDTMKVGKVYEELAKRAGEYIQPIGKTNPAVTEGVDNLGGAPGSEEKPEKVVGMSDILKKRRVQRSKVA